MSKNNKGVDLSDALNKTTSTKYKKNEESSSVSSSPETTKIVQWTIKYSGGYINNEKQANYVILVFVALAIIFSLSLMSSKEKTPQDTFAPPANAPQAEVIPPNKN